MAAMEGSTVSRALSQRDRFLKWMRFEPDCSLPELVKTVPHVAFEVDDLEAELEGQELLIPPNSPSPGVRVAFIVHDGAPVEFLQFDSPASNRAR